MLCVVDDAQWLDRPSADALVFAARRLRAERLAILFGAREGEVRRFEAAGVPDLALTGLDPPSAAAVLAAGRLQRGAVRYVSGCWPRPTATRWRCWSCRGPVAGAAGRAGPPAGGDPAHARAWRACSGSGSGGCPSPAQTALLIAAADNAGDVAGRAARAGRAGASR